MYVKKKYKNVRNTIFLKKIFIYNNKFKLINMTLGKHTKVQLLMNPKSKSIRLPLL